MPMPDENAGAGRTVYVWDVPTRLFHWGLAAAVTTSLASGEFGYMNIHVISGHVILALVIFRLVWGVIGGRHAQFSDFFASPTVVIRYARSFLRGGDAHLGHNPLGGWSVLAMLATLCTQVGSGLFANDDILTEGPLAKTVSKSTSDFLTYIHETSGNVLYALIALHLLAIVVYSVKGQGLIGAMITGRKIGQELPSENAKARGNLVAAGILAAFAAAIAYFVKTY